MTICCQKACVDLRRSFGDRPQQRSGHDTPEWQHYLAVVCAPGPLQSVIYTQLLHPVSWRSLFSNLTVRSDARCSRSLRFRSCNARGASNIPSQRATIVRPIRQAGNPLFSGYGNLWSPVDRDGLWRQYHFRSLLRRGCRLGKSLGDIGSVSLDGTFLARSLPMKTIRAGLSVFSIQRYRHQRDHFHGAGISLLDFRLP